MENPFKKAVAEHEEKIVEEIKNEEDNTKNETEEVTEQTETTEKEEEKCDINPLQEKYETLNNQYLRLAADFDNFRKRQEQEKEALLKYGAENTVKKLI